MIQGGDTGLRLRLDALEAKGLRLILDQARRQAVSRAFAWAAPASAVGGVVFVLSALIQRPSPVVGLAAVVLPPLVVGGVTYLGVRRAQSIERAAALARLDQRFGIKDRIQTADEFSRIADRSSFQSAALQEASPWLDRAANAPVVSTPVLTVRPSRLWLWLLLAFVLFASAFFIPGFGAGANPIQSPADETAAPAVPSVATAASKASPAVRDFDANSAVAVPRSGGRAGQAGEGEGVSSILRRLAALLSPDRSSAGGPRAPGKPGSGGEAAAGGGESVGRGALGMSGHGSSRGAMAAEPEAARTTPDDQAPVGEAGNQDQSDMADAPASSGQSAGGRQDAPSARQAEPERSGEGRRQSGEGKQPGGRSRRGDQDQQGGEQSGGQGESGQRSGADAGAKKGRGVSSLLLATPMQDRLAGMASPGRTSTTTRDGAPQAFPVIAGQAGDRGAARGEASRTAPRATSPQDQRLTRDYFTRRNASSD